MTSLLAVVSAWATQDAAAPGGPGVPVPALQPVVQAAAAPAILRPLPPAWPPPTPPQPLEPPPNSPRGGDSRDQSCRTLGRRSRRRAAADDTTTMTVPQLDLTLTEQDLEVWRINALNLRAYASAWKTDEPRPATTHDPDAAVALQHALSDALALTAYASAWKTDPPPPQTQPLGPSRPDPLEPHPTDSLEDAAAAAARRAAADGHGPLDLTGRWLIPLCGRVTSPQSAAHEQPPRRCTAKRISPIVVHDQDEKPPRCTAKRSAPVTVDATTGRPARRLQMQGSAAAPLPATSVPALPEGASAASALALPEQASTACALATALEGASAAVPALEEGTSAASESSPSSMITASAAKAGGNPYMDVFGNVIPMHKRVDFYGRRLCRSPTPEPLPIKRYKYGDYIVEGRRLHGGGFHVVRYISGPDLDETHEF